MRAEGHRGLVVERQVQIKDGYPGLAGAGPGDFPARGHLCRPVRYECGDADGGISEVVSARLRVAYRSLESSIPSGQLAEQVVY